MDNVLPEEGAASPDHQSFCASTWEHAARCNGVDLTGFDPKSSLGSRIAWALAKGLIIAALYTRYSTHKQGSTQDQIRAEVEFAARNKMYCPPEFLCVDEAVKGRKEDREGLNRLKCVLRGHHASCLLIYKLSRLFRQAYKSVGFINEEVVEEGLRAVAVSQGIDTANSKVWKLLVSLHGTMDEELLVAIADHVREGLVGLFLKGWVTGAIPVGYKAVEVPGAPPTRRNLPRKMPAVDEEVAAMIRQHYELIAGGMDIAEGWRQWRRDGGAADKRSTLGQMSYEAYRRMLSRAAYLGVWNFCRKKNVWKTKKDAIEQVDQPPEEVKTYICEELRIVSDELFWKVQEKLPPKVGPRLRRDKEHHLWDLAIGLFRCAACEGRRFHMAGSKGYMHCGNRFCPCRVMAHRRDAVEAVCAWASNAIRQDAALIDMVIEAFNDVSDMSKEAIDHEIETAQKRSRACTRRIKELEELLGTGDEDDAKRRKEQILAAQRERSACELQIAELQRSRGGGCAQAPTREEVELAVADLAKLLDDAASGLLGPEVVNKAVAVLAGVVGGQIVVHAQRRASRKRFTAVVRFTPRLVGAVRSVLGAATGKTAPTEPGEVEIFLRKPPRVDLMADDVKWLYDEQELGFEEINQRMEKKYGGPIGTGNCCAAYGRWYEIRDLPLPPPRTHTGRPRGRKAG